MDLIYTDKHLNDIGYLKDVSLDMAIGFDENNFELELPAKRHCMTQDMYFYAEYIEGGFVQHTEYGGIVDEVSSLSSDETVKYSGRTWHGILNSYVIEPEGDYLHVSGDANEVLKILTERCGVGQIFEVSSEASGIMVNYFFRYEYLYDGIKKMLLDDNGKTVGKLSIQCRAGKVHLEVLPAADYTDLDHFAPVLKNFRIAQKYNFPTHLICLGQGDMEARAVIHLFTDRNGNVQRYAWSNDPVKDRDYILDKRYQAVSGQDEITEVYDYPSAEITTNYVALQTIPEDWEDVCTQYFKKNGGQYEQLTTKKEKKYIAVTTRPADWDTAFEDYYLKNEKGKYVQVEGEEQQQYQPVTWEDLAGFWKSEYEEDLFYTYSDGTGKTEYRRLPTYTTNRYVVQKREPSDWAINWHSYYELTTDTKEYTLVQDKEFDKVKRSIDWQRKHYKAELLEKYRDKKIKITKEKCTKHKGKGAKNYTYTISYILQAGYSAVTGEGKDGNHMPAWKKKKYFTQYTSDPKKYTYEYITKNYGPIVRYTHITGIAPAFKSPVYRKDEEYVVYPKFQKGKIYKEVKDRYAELVRGGIERLKEAWTKGTLEADTNEYDVDKYDIGDTVGGADDVIGIQASAEITKKIIRIRDGIFSVSYEVGGQT